MDDRTLAKHLAKMDTEALAERLWARPWTSASKMIAERALAEAEASLRLLSQAGLMPRFVFRRRQSDL